MTDVASLGVWPLGPFAWCARSARTAPFRTRSFRAACSNEPITPEGRPALLAQALGNGPLAGA